MKWDHLSTHKPVNKAASLATSQAGINLEESDRLLLQQKQQEATKQKIIIDARIREVAKGTKEHKKLKAEARRLNRILINSKTKLNTKTKGQNRRHLKRIEKFIVEVCREQFTSEEWKVITQRAEIRMERTLEKKGYGEHDIAES